MIRIGVMGVLCSLCILGWRCTPARSTALTDQLLQIAREWGDTRFDEALVRERLRAIAQDALEIARADPGAPQSAALNRAIFDRWHFVREVQDRALRFALLPDVMDSRRGGCVGLGTLYLAVAEQLGWRFQGVMVPGHFFVRSDAAGTAHNVELLRRGEAMPDDWYRERYLQGAPPTGAYGRALSLAEVIGVVEYDAGSDRRRRGQLREALLAYDRARTDFPEFAEAHASHGAVAQLLGQLDRAQADYQTARRLNPQLSGIERNLELLERERAGRLAEEVSAPR